MCSQNLLVLAYAKNLPFEFFGPVTKQFSRVLDVFVMTLGDDSFWETVSP